MRVSVGAMDEHGERAADATPEEVGAGSGVAATDGGEEATPDGTTSDTGGYADTDSEWATLAGDQPAEEGAAAAALRDERPQGGADS